MGTAPDPEHHLAMPTPARVVSRSVRLLARLGMSQRLALGTVLVVAEDVRTSLVNQGQNDLTWINAVLACVADRISVLNPSPTDYQESDYADGTSTTAADDASGHRDTRQG